MRFNSKANREILDMSKMEKLLRAEQLTIAVHPDWQPFLGEFIRDYDDDPATALRYFTNNAPDGTNPRAMVAELDLSNIKNEVLALICMYLINTEREKLFEMSGIFDEFVKQLPNYDQYEGLNREVLWTNEFAADLKYDSSSVNSVFDMYLEREPERVSEYIDSYIETTLAFRSSPQPLNLHHPKNWNQVSRYDEKELKFLEDVLKGRKRTYINTKTTDTSNKVPSTKK